MHGAVCVVDQVAGRGVACFDSNALNNSLAAAAAPPARTRRHAPASPAKLWSLGIPLLTHIAHWSRVGCGWIAEAHAEFKSAM